MNTPTDIEAAVDRAIAAEHRALARARRPRLPGRAGIALGVLGFALFLAGHFSETAAEFYGENVYPVIARVVASVTAILPFSVAEWVFILLPLAVLHAPWSAWQRMRRAHEPTRIALLAAATKLLGRAGTLWFLFLVMWGLNYDRPLPPGSFGLGARPQGEAAKTVVNEIAQRLDAERGLVPEDEHGVAAEPLGLRALDTELMRLQAGVLRDAGLPPVEQGRVKTFLFSPVTARWGVSGVYGPFTGEPNLTWPSAPALVPFTLAHERAHLSGFAPEETASFVALLTCWRSPRPEVRYAAWLALWLEMHRAGSGRAPGVGRDIRAIADYIEAHRGREAPIVWKAYGGYLKAHGVKGGTLSYTRVSDLAFRWIEAHGMPPGPEPPKKDIAAPPEPAETHGAFTDPLAAYPNEQVDGLAAEVVQDGIHDADWLLLTTDSPDSSPRFTAAVAKTLAARTKVYRDRERAPRDGRGFEVRFEVRPEARGAVRVTLSAYRAALASSATAMTFRLNGNRWELVKKGSVRDS